MFDGQVSFDTEHKLDFIEDPLLEARRAAAREDLRRQRETPPPTTADAVQAYRACSPQFSALLRDTEEALTARAITVDNLNHAVNLLSSTAPASAAIIRGLVEELDAQVAAGRAALARLRRLRVDVELYSELFVQSSGAAQ